MKSRDEARESVEKLGVSNLSSLRGRSLLLTREWSSEDIETLLDVAEAFQALDQAGIATALFPNELDYALFFDASTRTKSSWAGAAARLGSKPVIVDGVVYVVSDAGYLICLKVSDGTSPARPGNDHSHLYHRPWAGWMGPGPHGHRDHNGRRIQLRAERHRTGDDLQSHPGRGGHCYTAGQRTARYQQLQVPASDGCGGVRCQ